MDFLLLLVMSLVGWAGVGVYIVRLSNRVHRLEDLINNAAPGELDKIGVEGTSFKAPTHWVDDYDAYPSHKPLR